MINDMYEYTCQYTHVCVYTHTHMYMTCSYKMANDSYFWFDDLKDHH